MMARDQVAQFPLQGRDARGGDAGAAMIGCDLRWERAEDRYARKQISAGIGGPALADGPLAPDRPSGRRIGAGENPEHRSDEDSRAAATFRRRHPAPHADTDPADRAHQYDS